MKYTLTFEFDVADDAAALGVADEVQDATQGITLTGRIAVERQAEKIAHPPAVPTITAEGKRRA